MKSLWNWFWKDSSRYSFAAILFVAGIVFWGGFNTFMEYTNTMNFCISCHEMEKNVFEEYKKTVHYNNRTGVRAVCADCHVPKEWVPKVLRKVKATRELYHKVMGTIDTPEKFEAKRLELARNVWAEMKANDSHECRNCHGYEAMHWEKQGKRGATTMQDAAKEGIACIECHKGIAHKLPNLGKAYATLRDDLMAAIKTETITGGTAVAVATKMIHTDKSAESGQVAEILPLTELEVLETDGDWLKVRLTAWDREGAPTWFAKFNAQMDVAKLKIDGMDLFETLDSKTHPVTELTWNKVTVEGWTTREGMSGDKARVTAYAENLWRDDCGLCHNLHPKDTYDSLWWMREVKAMRRFTNLDQEQMTIVLKLLQGGSKDMTGDGMAEE